MDGRRRVVEYEPDRTLRDTEQVPLLDEAAGVKGFLRREALLHAPDARYDPGSVGIGCEIGFTRHFHRPKPMRTFDEIPADLPALQRETEYPGGVVGG